eukprot:1154313-Pelagomonas_calceolata.AAC.4
MMKLPCKHQKYTAPSASYHTYGLITRIAQVPLAIPCHEFMMIAVCDLSPYLVLEPTSFVSEPPGISTRPKFAPFVCSKCLCCTRGGVHAVFRAPTCTNARIRCKRCVVDAPELLFVNMGKYPTSRAWKRNQDCLYLARADGQAGPNLARGQVGSVIPGTSTLPGLAQSLVWSNTFGWQLAVMMRPNKGLFSHIPQLLMCGRPDHMSREKKSAQTWMLHCARSSSYSSNIMS